MGAMTRRFVVAIMMLPLTEAFAPTVNHMGCNSIFYSSKDDKEWTSDFDDFYPADDDKFKLSNILEKRASQDLSACEQRQFSLGVDLVLSDFAGSLGFDEVTDWEYYYEDEDNGERKVVQPPPLDPTKPKRTRSSSGSVVRIFRGEFAGRLGSVLSSQGLDRRVLVKEFSGDLALDLARAELQSIGKLQSELVASRDDSAKKGNWVKTAAARSAMFRQDDSNLIKLVGYLSKMPYTGIMGEVNLAELEDMDPNEFYRALGVAPPKPNAIWIVYEYPGLSTVASYCKPAETRRASLPIKRGILGGIVPAPPVPAWEDRANYVTRGIMKAALEAVALLHDNGIAHRSIGRSSILLSSIVMDKSEGSSIYSTNPSRLVVKLADLGFSGAFEISTLDPGFCSRARSFGLNFRQGTSTLVTTGFAIAEDLHALGFVFLGLLLTSLAEVPTPQYNLPATDEDTLQRLLTDIFEKDIDQFREYVEAEEIWSNVVELLDENDAAGWKLLSSLCFAREQVSENQNEEQLLTARDLLASPFFQR